MVDFSRRDFVNENGDYAELHNCYALLHYADPHNHYALLRNAEVRNNFELRIVY